MEIRAGRVAGLVLIMTPILAALAWSARAVALASPADSRGTPEFVRVLTRLRLEVHPSSEGANHAR